MPEAQDSGRNTAAAADDDDEISLVDLAATIWKRKWLIAGVTAAAAVLSVVYALLQPNVYTSRATLLPISGTSASSLSQYAGLASMAGISLPGASSGSPLVKIEAILRSRSLLEKLAAEESISTRLLKDPGKLEKDKRDYALVKSLGRILVFSTDAKTSIISVSATTRDPVLSRDIVKSAVQTLVNNLAARALSSASKSKAVLETQVADQELKVRRAQARVTDYQKKNRGISVQTQGGGMLSLYQGLIQQRIALEIEISRLESALSSDNPKIVSAKTQLEAINGKIQDFESTGGGIGPSLSEAPSKMMEYANLTAELELAMKLYGSLAASLETMRIQEAQEKLFVEVIDDAIVPLEKSKPSRAMICVVGTMAGAFLALLLVFVLDAAKKLIADPEVRGKF